MQREGGLVAFVLCFLIAFVSFSWSLISQGGLFSLAGDFNSQQITFAMAANDAIRSGQVVWDWSLDLGSSFIGGMTFYLLGNPSFWVSLLFPSRYFMYVVGWLYMLKYAFAGLTSYLWISRYVRRREVALTAAIFYAFSGFMSNNLLFYHFHDVVALFPLMLITLDGLCLEKKRGRFVWAVFFNALVCYFFIFGEIIFLAAYFILRFLMEDFGKWIRRLPDIILEGALGCALTGALLLPAYLFTVQNPRVSFDYVGSNSLVFSAERYLYILKALIFPGEVMSEQSAVVSRNFSSCAAYLPMASMVLVIAFLCMRRRHWLKRMLVFCLIMAVIPILNASFSLFAGLYCRWYYMAVLMMALASGLVLDRYMADGPETRKGRRVLTAITKGTVIWLAITAAFIFFLVFVKWSNKEPSKIYRPDIFVLWSIISVSGTLLTWLLPSKVRRRQTLAFLGGTAVFAALTTGITIFLYQQAHGTDARHVYDNIMTSGEITCADPAYRFYNNSNYDTLAHGFSGRGNFCSTVSGSIFRFYEGLGLERSTNSPEGPEGTRSLISARYIIEKEARENEDPVEVKEGRYTACYVYEDETVPPIGFTYDTYMTASELAETPKELRSLYMLKTLVVSDEAEPWVGEVLTHYDEALFGAVGEGDAASLGRAHLDESAHDVVRTTDSYRCLITADDEKYAFFSIPNDEGWSARVNGEEAEIVDACGFMAVKVKKGENEIIFRYRTPGLTAGVGVSLGALALYLAYLLYLRERKRRIGLPPGI